MGVNMGFIDVAVQSILRLYGYRYIQSKAKEKGIELSDYDAEALYNKLVADTTDACKRGQWEAVKDQSMATSYVFRVFHSLLDSELSNRDYAEHN
jgi:hypothetical protein